MASESSAKVVMASQFRQECLTLLDQVATTKVPIVVTKHGRPVARVVPIEDHRPGRPVMGSVTLIADDDADYFATGESWAADAPSSG